MTIDRRQFLKLGSLATAGVSLLSLSGNAAVLKRALENESLILASESAIQSISFRQLAKGFVSPPDSAKPATYWWWFNNNVNEKGITRDLEEFKAKGMGGVLLICSANGYGGGHIPSGPAFLSTEWRALFRHSLQEANRLGLEVGVNLCGGWAMGGPWIKPEHSGRWILQSELSVEGPQKFSAPLPLPGHRDKYDNAHAFNVPSYVNLPLSETDYRDTAVVAFKEPEGSTADLKDDRLKALAAKSNRLDSDVFIRAKKVMQQPLEPWTAKTQDNPVAPSEVIDLTARLSADGKLEWDVPPGRWTIIRTGHRMTGARTVLALPEADGLEVDWLNEAGVDQQFEHLGKVLLQEAGPLAGTTLKYFHDDSFEDGYPNWTDNFLQKFTHYRGYDATPYLPVFAGKLVGSAEISDRFLYDYRKTVADCMADAHYKRFADLCHENGLLVQNESAGPSWSGTMCMDGLKNLGRSDRPMGEFWQDGAFVEDGQNKVTKMVASAAHIYGKKLVSAEGFTSFRPHWSEYPAVLKPTADRAFCEGVNRVVIHTSTASKPEDGLPGYEYAAGTHFNPNITWWNQSGAFLNYLGRCQYMLQEGQFVADVLYYNGDWAPNLVEPKHTDPSLGPGYDYDVCNAEVLLTRLSVRDGRLTLPDGMSYHLLVLPESTFMPLEVAQKLFELVRAGATIAGPRPMFDPGLKNYPQCDSDLQKVAAELWGKADGATVTQNTLGKGRVFWGVPLRQILQNDRVQPDFEATNASLHFIHRQGQDYDVYFLSNQKDQPQTLDCIFRVSGRQPEVWDPVTAKIAKVNTYRQSDGRTTLPLEFLPHQALFVVFKKPRLFARVPKVKEQGSNVQKTQPVQELTGSWVVSFNPEMGGPAKVIFNQLEDWTQRPEKEIKNYSGAATYTKLFDVKSPLDPAAQFYLHLGEVKNIAEVRLNGNDLGVVWTAPWRVNVSGILKPTGNLLEIKVVNLWPNRLIGDAALPPDQRFTKTNVEYKPDAPLLPSGLLGPVTLQNALSV